MEKLKQKITQKTGFSGSKRDFPGKTPPRVTNTLRNRPGRCQNNPV